MIEDILQTVTVPDEAWQPVAMARGLLRGYDARWHGQSLQLLECEKTYQSPLYNLQTQRRSRTFTLAGKIDKLADQEGLTLYDHKTTSLDISDPNSVYWRQLAVESQPSHYTYLLHLNGIKVDRVCWDVVRKPGIRPRRLKKDEIKEVGRSGVYFGHPVSEPTQQGVFDGWLSDENAELYELRVWRETTDNPENYFQRRSVTRLNDEIAEYANELWQVGQSIKDTRRNEHWFRNSGACLLYGTPCEYLGICSGHDTPDSDRWTNRDQRHSELDLGHNGVNVLTNSRIRCFQTCRRKHFYRYELGLVRVDEEDRESLFFGSLFHDLLDLWWQAQGVHHEHCDDRQATEVCQSASGA